LLERDTVTLLGEMVKNTKEAINEFQEIPLFKIKPSQYKDLKDSLNKVNSTVVNIADATSDLFHDPSIKIEIIDFF
jgi:hypothetical protein